MANEDLLVSLGLDTGGFIAGARQVGASLGGIKANLASMALVAGGAFAVGSAQEFESTLSRIQANARTSVGSMNELGDSILNVSSSSLRGAFNQQQVADALAGVVTEAESAGEALGIVEAAGRLAATTGIDLADASGLVADSLSTFGLHAGEAARVSQALYEAARQTGTGIDELAQAMGNTAPLARGLGLGFEQSAALAGVLKDAGVDSANSLLTAWTKAGRSGGLPELLGAINAAIRNGANEGLTAGEALAEAFGRGGVAALALVQNAGSLQSVLDAVSQRSNSLNEKFANSVTASTAASNQFSNLKVELGQGLLPAVNNMLGGFVEFFKFLSQRGLVDDFAAAVVSLGSAFVLFKLGVVGATAAATLFSFAAAPLTPWILGAALAIGGIIFIWKEWDQIVSFFSKTVKNVWQWIQKFWFLLGPLGFAIKGTIELFKHWDEVAASFRAMWEGIVSFFDGLWDDFIQIGRDIINGLIAGIKGGIDAVVDAVGDVGNAIKDGFTDFFDISSPSGLMEEYGGDLTDGLALGINEGISSAESAVENLYKGINSKASTLTQHAIESFRANGRTLTLAGKETQMGLPAGEQFSSNIQAMNSDVPAIARLTSEDLAIGRAFGSLAGISDQMGVAIADVRQMAKLLGVDNVSGGGAGGEGALIAAAVAKQWGLRPPGFAHGVEGIIRQPGLAFLGEHGAESVRITPQARGGNDRAANTFNVTVYANDRQGGQDAGQALGRELRRLGVLG